MSGSAQMPVPRIGSEHLYQLWNCWKWRSLRLGYACLCLYVNRKAEERQEMREERGWHATKKPRVVFESQRNPIYGAFEAKLAGPLWRCESPGHCDVIRLCCSMGQHSLQASLDTMPYVILAANSALVVADVWIMATVGKRASVLGRKTKDPFLPLWQRSLNEAVTLQGVADAAKWSKEQVLIKIIKLAAYLHAGERCLVDLLYLI